MARASVDGWDPQQYERFAEERSRPFFDLLALVAAVPGGGVVDLGCGTGELTARLHAHTGAGSTLGVDNSAAMLAQAPSVDGVTFREADIASLEGDDYDVVFSNAALQWLPDHEHLLARVAAMVAPGGQLAVQVPANNDHPSHTIAAAAAHESPFVEAMGGQPPPDMVNGVLKPERYAELLDELGFVDQHVRLQVYGHRLPSADAVVEWTRGTTLVRFRRVLSPDLFDAYVERYRARLVAELGNASPYFYAFKRILLWGRRN